MNFLIFLVGDPLVLRYWSASFFGFGIVLLTIGFATETDTDFITGAFLLRLLSIIMGIICVCTAAFVLLLELFIRL